MNVELTPEQASLLHDLMRAEVLDWLDDIAAAPITNAGRRRSEMPEYLLAESTLAVLRTALRRHV